MKWLETNICNMPAKEIVTSTQLITRALSYNCNILLIFQCKLLWSDLRYSTILWIFLYRLVSATASLLAKLFLCQQNIAWQNYLSLCTFYICEKSEWALGMGKDIVLTHSLQQIFHLTTKSMIRMLNIPHILVSQLPISTKISCKRSQNTWDSFLNHDI